MRLTPSSFFYIYLLLSSGRVLSCGPWLPDSALKMSEQEFLEAPRLGFEAELRRILPDGYSGEKEVTPVNPVEEVRADMEGEDQELIESALASLRETREKITKVKALNRSQIWSSEPSFDFVEEPEAMISLRTTEISEHLPEEFRWYLEGARHIVLGNSQAARAAWNRVMELPPEQRQNRTVMAAYMLARTSPDQTTEAYQHVRDLTEAGFADPRGLAGTTWGWQGRAELDQGLYSQAFDSYTERWRTPDGLNDFLSVKKVCQAVFEKATEEEWERLIHRPRHQSILTAYASTRSKAHPEYAERLLDILSDAEVRIEEAGSFALVAYEMNDLERTQTWIDVSRPDDALALWIQSKLWLRQGKVEEGKAAMVALTGQIQGDFPGALRLDVNRAWEELGLLRMKAQEYGPAALAFLNAGSWVDCAYVLEQVMNLDESVAWVKNLPPDSTSTSFRMGESDPHELVARRAMRQGNFDVALSHFNDENRKMAEQLRQHHLIAMNHHQKPRIRAKAFWDAALITRTNGLELYATELSPDFEIFDGSYTTQDIESVRRKGMWTSERDHTEMTFDERSRVERHKRGTTHRFHYRYRAAMLAELAAGLLPNHDQDAAKIYWRSGDWLKRRDPQAADRYFKMLVVRCPHTELGKEAREINWFPKRKADEVVPFVERESPDS